MSSLPENQAPAFRKARSRTTADDSKDPAGVSVMLMAAVSSVPQRGEN